MSSMSMAFRSLRRRRTRTILTVSGIVVGVGMILVLLSLAAGTSTQASGFLRNVLAAEITVVNDTRPSFGGFSGGGGSFSGGGGFAGGGGGRGFSGGLFVSGNTLPESYVSTIGSMRGVSSVSPQLNVRAYLNGSQILLYGVDSSTYASATNGLNIVSGSMINSASAYQIVLDNSTAESLNITVGSSVQIGANSTGANETYTVVGLYSSGTTFGLGNGYVSLQNAQSLDNQSGLVSEIFVKTTTPSNVNSVASSIDSSISGVSAQTASNVVNPASNLSGTLTSFFTIIGLVALLAGGFGVVNTMMMSISERTREIGTLRAIGASKGQVMRMFLSEAFLIGIIGGIAGVVIGGIVTFAIPAFTKAASSVRGGGGLFGGSLAPALTGENLLLSLALGTLVGILAGIYPAWRASRLNPVEALRHV